MKYIFVPRHLWNRIIEYVFYYAIFHFLLQRSYESFFTVISCIVFAYIIQIWKFRNEIYSKLTYISRDVSPTLSKTEIILKMSDAFLTQLSDNLLLIKDQNVIIEFVSEQKIIVSGKENNVQKILSIVAPAFCTSSEVL